MDKALAACRKHKAKLVIAKLDRLARNVALIANLMDGKVDLVCCDMPQANRLTIHVLAAVAEHEREMISERTKAGLAAAKRGVSSSAARDCPQSTKRDGRAPWSEHGPLRRLCRSWLGCRPALWLRS